MECRWFSDYTAAAQRPIRRTLAPPCCLPPSEPYRHPEKVTIRGSMAGPHVLLPTRFAGHLAAACARLRPDVACYTLIAVGLHDLLLASLPAHSELVTQPKAEADLFVRCRRSEATDGRNGRLAERIVTGSPLKGREGIHVSTL